MSQPGSIIAFDEATRRVHRLIVRVARSNLSALLIGETGASDGKPSVGVIAQEVEKVFPQLISTDERGMKSVAYANLVAPLVEAVKELNGKRAAAEERIGKLEREKPSLRTRLDGLEKSVARLALAAPARPTRLARK